MIRPYYTLNLFNFTAAGFGLRVVGGKTGTDGRTFAYVMWTLPDGPAAKVGIQRGDKVRSRPNFFLLLRHVCETPSKACTKAYCDVETFFARDIFFLFQSDAYRVWKIEIGVSIVSIGHLDLGNKNVLATCAHRNG